MSEADDRHRSTEFFDYDLPANRIAQRPATPRDSARLLVDQGSTVAHHTVADLPSLLAPGDVLVVNDTRVSHARLELVKPTGGRVEVLLLQPMAPTAIESDSAVASDAPTGEAIVGERWEALVRGGRRVRPGTPLLAGDTEVVVVGDDLGAGRRAVEVLVDGLMARAGRVPLPPYITAELDDPERYQTVYAERPGSVAAPTAGLHLTPQLLDDLTECGVEVIRVELRVGIGTFRPITAERVGDHQMHAETYAVDHGAWERIRAADRVVAVGTTVVRTLESVAASGRLAGSTELFITRGHRWAVVDRLLTNFHVPRSSLLVLVDAFVGPRWRDLYDEALVAGYRFLSFGDAMLVDRRQDGRP